MAATRPSPGDDDPIETSASEWLARRERGLTATEQDAYLQWLSEDPARGRAVARLEKTWRALDILGERHALRGTRPNPDLLAVKTRPRTTHARTLAIALGVAATVVLLLVLVHSKRRFAPVPGPAVANTAGSGVRVITPPEKIGLSDGSVVELNNGTIQPVFTPGERRVRLLRGEAHFAVAKNPARPFIVDTGHVTVRAIGTAFDVVRAEASVEVLVTEGKVQVQHVAAEAPAAAVEAGQRAVVDTASAGSSPVVSSIGAADVDRALAWQSVRLEFSDIPLGEAVAEFNLRNSRQLVFGDADTPKLLIGGSFRADKVDAFVRLLEQGFGVKATTREDGTIVLQLAK